MKKRYIVYLCLILLLVFGIIVPPVLPVIQLPGEILFEWSEGSFLKGFFGDGFYQHFFGDNYHLCSFAGFDL